MRTRPRRTSGITSDRGTSEGARIFGPTGVGKTAVAIELAERLREPAGGPVAISADALQVYRGLEILTGAATPAEQERLEHRLLSFVPVTETFSAGQFARWRTPRSTPRSRGAAPDRRRRHRPLPPGGAHRPGAAPTARRRACASGSSPPRRARPEALHAELAERARGGRRDRSRGPHPRRARARAARDGGGAGAGGRGVAAVDRRAAPPDAAVRPHDGARAPLRAHRRARGPDDRRRRGGGGAPRRRRRRVARRARKALGFEELLRGDVDAMKRRTRNYAKRQLTWMRRLPGVIASTSPTPRTRASAESWRRTREDARP